MKENKIDIAKLIIENMPQHTELRKRTIKTRLETSRNILYNLDKA